MNHFILETYKIKNVHYSFNLFIVRTRARLCVSHLKYTYFKLQTWQPEIKSNIPPRGPASPLSFLPDPRVQRLLPVPPASCLRGCALLDRSCNLPVKQLHCSCGHSLPPRGELCDRSGPGSVHRKVSECSCEGDSCLPLYLGMPRLTRTAQCRISPCSGGPGCMQERDE